MIELMIVVAILGILVSTATVSYNHFVIKAKAVEGEIVVHEVERLEHLYHASNHAYTDSLADLGFAMIGTLANYTPEVRIGSSTDKINYQIRALPGTASETDAWLLTNYRDGSIRVDRISVKDLRAVSTVRYLGNASPLMSGGVSGNNEPEWFSGGSNSQCQECGRVVLNQRN